MNGSRGTAISQYPWREPWSTVSLKWRAAELYGIVSQELGADIGEMADSSET